MACRVIRQARELGITSVKLSPHYHEASPGLILISSSDGYAIYEETQRGTEKNTSRMLDAGADRVFLACAWDYPVEEAFAIIIKNIPPGTPIICESPSLRKYVEPGVFIIMERQAEDNSEIKDLKKLPHLKFRLDELHEIEEIPVIFKNGRWSEQKSI